VSDSEYIDFENRFQVKNTLLIDGGYQVAILTKKRMTDENIHHTRLWRAIPHRQAQQRFKAPFATDRDSKRTQKKPSESFSDSEGFNNAKSDV